MNFNLLFIAIFLVSFTSINAQTFTAETSSSMKWTGEKVTGKHYGSIGIKSGEFTIENNMISSGSFTVDMNSITCEDIENETYNKKLVGHLKSDDFFGVSNFPVATFVVKESSEIKGGNATVKGELTIKGITQEVEFKAVTATTENGMNIYGNIVLDRTLFNVKYGSGSFFDSLGDKTIYDEFTVKLNISATQS